MRLEASEENVRIAKQVSLDARHLLERYQDEVHSCTQCGASWGVLEYGPPVTDLGPESSDFIFVCENGHPMIGCGIYIGFHLLEPLRETDALIDLEW